ncbi:thioredoxin-like protein [Rhexocercosporidium sp. MPI-PUGE-AT-0058]|nr:thioredoxin-like protein [Rhexocercosporidium sp. MPI-PUGE-AT-0058]
MAAIIRKIFRRKKNIPLACATSLENEPDHVHTGACFIDIQPLSIVELFHYDVTYFNHMGWEDTFGDSRWDKRQQAYLRKWARTTKFTPQVIADGVADGTGAEKGAVDGMVDAARGLRTSMPWHIIVDTNDAELRIDSDGEDVGPFDIYLVNYDPKTVVVKVGKGPNKGKKISHKNLVKDVIRIGEWSGGNLTIDLPDMKTMVGTGLETVAIVQGANGGPIVAAQKL